MNIYCRIDHFHYYETSTLLLPAIVNELIALIDKNEFNFKTEKK